MAHYLKRLWHKFLNISDQTETPQRLPNTTTKLGHTESDQDIPNKAADIHDPTDVAQEASRTLNTPSATDDVQKSKDNNDGKVDSRVAKLLKVAEARTFKLEHGDHFDDIDTRNSWTYTTNVDSIVDFWNDWVRMEEFSVPSDELYKDKKVQECLNVLASLSLSTLPLIEQLYESQNLSWGDCRIPLFVGDNGDEYQVRLRYFIDLPDLDCPSNLIKAPHSPAPVQLLHSRASTGSPANAPLGPTLVVPLGELQVRGNSRYPEDLDDDETITERTDWSVVVDVENEQLPVWVIVSRQALADRRENANLTAERPLTLFNGLMAHENGDYDSACILSSIHQLGTTKATAPAFSDVCEMVRKSRGTRDPVIYLLPEDGLKTIAAGKGKLTDSCYPATELPERPLAGTSNSQSELPNNQPEGTSAETPTNESNGLLPEPEHLVEDGKTAVSAGPAQ